jgi:RNA polymerase sigma-70 factor, ECF subfamily
MPPPASSAGPEPDPGEPSVTRGLARRAQHGDAPSFEALYERLAPALYAWTRLRMLPPLRARMDEHDVMGEVWLRALKAFPSYDAGRGAFRPWFFQVAKHAMLDLLRRTRAVDAAGRGRGEGFPLSQVPGETTAVSRRVASDESVAAFLERLTSLSEEDRELLVHCGLEGMAMVDAAERLGLTKTAAERRWQRLRKRIAERGIPAGLLETV